MSGSNSFSIQLKGSLSSPSLLKNLRNLNENLGEAGEKYTTLCTAKVYADVSSQAWNFQGVFSQFQTAQHLKKFYEQQKLFLDTYCGVLEGIGETLTNCIGQFYDASQIMPGSFQSTHIVKENIRHYLEVLVNSFNSYDANYGYLFSGTQVDQKPINTKLVADASNSLLRLEELPDYFLNGRTPDVQNPLVFYAKNQEVYSLPLKANDFQAAVRVLCEFLQLDPNSTSEDLNCFRGALDESYHKIMDGITKISGHKTSFEEKIQLYEKLSSSYASWRDEQLDVDPVEAALKFQETAQALKAFLNYITFIVSVSKTFQEITSRVMI
ncbi:MAG: hypothetical protein K2P90_00030 [Holosporales bacterium]|nr:hypothetical protein [Holosporales bacterium]